MSNKSAYRHTEDIDGSKVFKADDIDAEMHVLINHATGLFTDAEKMGATFSSSVEFILQAFLTTHKSIRLLLRQVDSDPNYAADAMSLVREQIEKVFLITLLLDDPAKWVPVYFKDDFRRFYEYEVLLNAEERKDLPTQKQYESTREQLIKDMQNMANITALELEYIEFKFHNPGTPLPAHLHNSKVLEFPTPGMVKDHITDKSAEPLLLRWHREYKRICGYNHIGLDKMQLNVMASLANNISESHRQIFLEKDVILPVMATSYVTTASACTEAWRYLKKQGYNLEKTALFLDALFTFWNTLRQQSLMAKVFWDIYAKNVLPPILGQS